MYPNERPLSPRHERLSRLDPEAYLSQMGIAHYLNDVTHLLVSHKDIKPVDFLRTYFANAAKGLHVVHRPYYFVISTSYNRCSFALCFDSAARKLCVSSTLSPTSSSSLASLTKEEYTQIAVMLCAEFPVSVIDFIYTMLSRDQATSSTPSTSVSAHAMCRGLLVFLFFKEYFEDLTVIMSKSIGGTMLPATIIGETTSMQRLALVPPPAPTGSPAKESEPLAQQQQHHNARFWWRPSQERGSFPVGSTPTTGAVPDGYMIAYPGQELLSVVFHQKSIVVEDGVPVALHTLFAGFVECSAVYSYIAGVHPALFKKFP